MDEKNIRNKLNEEDTLKESVVEESEKKSRKNEEQLKQDGAAEKIKHFFAKIGKWAKDSKLNMSVLITTGVMFILLLIVVIIIIGKGGVDNKYQQTTVADPTDKSNENGTTMPTPAEDELFTTDINEEETGNFVTVPEILSAKLSIKSSWVSGGVCYTQYNVAIKNVSGKKIDGWAAVIRTDSSMEITDNWNAQYLLDGKNITILPFPDNEVIDKDETINVGFVVSSYRYVYFNEVTVFQKNNFETYKISVSQIQYVTNSTDDNSRSDDETSTKEEKTTHKEEETTDKEDESIRETTSVEETTSQEESTEETTSVEETTSQEESTEETTSVEETTTLQ